MNRWIGSGRDWGFLLGILKASENAISISITIAIPVKPSVDVNMSKYEGCMYPKSHPIVCRNRNPSAPTIRGKSHVR